MPLTDELDAIRRPRRRAIVIGAIVIALIAIVIIIAVRSGGSRSRAVAVAGDAGVAATEVALALDAAAIVDAAVPTEAAPRPAVRDTSELDGHLAAAEHARRAGNSLKQLAEANLALDVDPRSAKARYLMGDALVTTGDLANGCRYLRGARRLPAAAARATAAGCPASPD